MTDEFKLAMSALVPGIRILASQGLNIWTAGTQTSLRSLRKLCPATTNGWFDRGTPISQTSRVTAAIVGPV
jgi:hypothetical protein